MPSAPVVPAFEDVRAAAAVLEGRVHRTPILTSAQLDASLGMRVLMKAENLQRTGAFKIRGAHYALSLLPPGEGVVAFSSGNHAQAVALAAREQGRSAVIVMPADAPRSKAEATAGYGAEIVAYDRFRESREEIAQQLAAERGAHIIPPFDHPAIAAGQGTAALELLEDADELDALLVPCGGGGLLAGTLLAAEALSPACRVYGVEPEAGDDVRRSLASGRREQIDVPSTIADGAQTRQVGACTFPVIQRLAAGILTASDAGLTREMAFLAQRMKVLVEPTGVLGLAGLRSLASELAGARVGVILSGGNVDLERFGQLVVGLGTGVGDAQRHCSGADSDPETAEETS